MSRSQSGFRPGVSAHETVAALKSVLDGRKARQLNTFVAFIDFETAFPSTFKPLVWNRLAEAGVQGHLWRVTRELYANVRSRVDHPAIPPSEFFHIPEGLC
jgi:hypothetical protein